MKLAKMDWKQVTAIENADKIEYLMQVKIFPNRVEISFHNGKEKLPFLFRCSHDGRQMHFVSLPLYLTYSRTTLQLPRQLRELVVTLRAFPPAEAIKILNDFIL